MVRGGYGIYFAPSNAQFANVAATLGHTIDLVVVTALGLPTLNDPATNQPLTSVKSALLKTESDKVDLNIIFTGVGEVSESDVQLAAASKAVVVGFHTQLKAMLNRLLNS